VHAWVKDEIREQIGLGNELRARPRGKRVDDFMTAGGARKGTDEVIVCRAFFNAMNKFNSLSKR